MLAACKMYTAHVFQFILSEVKGPSGATVLRFWFVSHSLSEGRSSGTNWGVFLIFTVFLGRRFLFFLPAPFDSLHFLLSFEISTWRFREQKHLPARRKRVHCRLVYRGLALLNWFTIIRVYLGVRTCELFHCFVPFVFLGFIVLTSLFYLFYVTGELNRFLHRGWAHHSNKTWSFSPNKVIVW